MESITIKVPVGKIISGTDRKYGGEGNIETLAQSIKEHGLIHPLAVKENPEKEGTYRVIAGRRRFTAVKSLGMKTVEVTVYPENTDEAAIALAENVNREDMHPLDEAETFRRKLDAGQTLEGLAKYYDRSVSGIYQRTRLTNLTDSLKGLFRDGRINLSGAAILAGLPEENQGVFFKKFEKKTGEINYWSVEEFVHQVQHCRLISGICDKECDKCKDRTHNTDPSLFEEHDHLSDVCLNETCYNRKWMIVIDAAVKKSLETEKPPENKIILSWRIPKFIPKKTKSIILSDTEYDFLEGNYSVTQDAKKKKDTAWQVDLDVKNDSIVVRRVSYQKTPDIRGSSEGKPDPVLSYGLDVLELPPEEAKEIAEKVSAKCDQWDFSWEVKNKALNTIIEKRTKEDPAENMASLYFQDKFGEEDTELFKRITGLERITDIPKDGMAQRLFHFLVVKSLRAGDITAPDKTHTDSLFWKYAGLSKEAYTEFYKDTVHEVIGGVCRRKKK
jgi:ParB/RepB/Spo0J family partition protein